MKIQAFTACLFHFCFAFCWPAIEIKRSKGISRGKTDKTDSKDIAFYALTHLHKLQLTNLPEKEILKLKLLFTEREKLMKAVKMLDTTKENETFFAKGNSKGCISCKPQNCCVFEKSIEGN